MKLIPENSSAETFLDLEFDPKLSAAVVVLKRTFGD